MDSNTKKFLKAVRAEMADRSGDDTWLSVALESIPAGDAQTVSECCDQLEAECYEPKHCGVEEGE